MYCMICKCRCKGNPSATPSQPDVKRPKTPTKEVSKAKRVKNDKDDKKRTETKFTEDKKTAEEDVNAYGNSKHPKRYTYVPYIWKL